MAGVEEAVRLDYSRILACRDGFRFGVASPLARCQLKVSIVSSGERGLRVGRKLSGVVAAVGLWRGA